MFKVQLISFYHISIEKLKIVIIFYAQKISPKKKENKTVLKKFTSLVNEFILHNCRNNKKIQICIFFYKSEKITSPANEFHRSLAYKLMN